MGSPIRIRRHGGAEDRIPIHDPMDEHNRKHKSRVRSVRVQRWRLQWRLSKTSTKISIATMVFLTSLFGLIGLWDKCFYRTGGMILLSSSHPRMESSEETPPSSFAVVINTFRRPERLRQTVRHYAETCGKTSRVGQVFVVWADQETEPPSSTDEFFGTNFRSNTTTITSNRVDVRILRKSKDSLNARFEPIPQLTTESVFMVDDDVRVACHSLHMAFTAWTHHPQAMVGYYPRLAASSSKQQFVYHLWPKIYWTQTFNMILTKASFLHSKYLDMYTDDDSFPKEIKDYVDEHRNCEDIAMSLLVANHTKLEEHKTTPIVYVEGSVSDVGLFGGISSSGSWFSSSKKKEEAHFETRSHCLTHLTELLLQRGWESPLQRRFSLPKHSWTVHSPGFWWQAKPSNSFEWLGLSNFFS